MAVTDIKFKNRLALTAVLKWKKRLFELWIQGDIVGIKTSNLSNNLEKC